MVTVTFDKTLLELLEATEGSLLPPHGQTFFFWNANGNAYDIGDCLMGYGLYADGPGLLATLKFRGKGLNGTSPLAFSATTFSDINLNPITVATAGGIVYIQGDQSPTIAVTSPPSGGVYASLPPVTLHCQDDNGLDRAYYQIDGCNGAWTELWSYNSGSTDTTFNWNPPVPAEGTHTVHFKITDDAGQVNLDSCSYSWTITYDHTSPAVVVSSPPGNNSYPVLPTLTLNVHDNLGLNQAYYQIDNCHGALIPLWSFNLAGTDTMVTLPLSGIAEGPHTLYFRAIDDAGNINADTCSYWWNFIFDQTFPAVTVNSPPSGGTYGALPTLSLTFHDNLGLNQGFYQIDDCHGSWSPLWMGNSYLKDLTLDWTIPELVEGSHAVYFKISDDAGNVNSNMCTYSWNLTYTGVTFTCGDANGDKKINVGDAVFIISYIFRNGPAPNPLEAADANCDNKINVGDAVYLISYIFRGGPAPCANCP